VITVMTVGYQGRTAEELVELLDAAGVKALVDVRLTPLSRKTGLSKHRLAARLADVGIDYVHLPPLGNPRENRDAFRRGDPEARERYAARLGTPEARSALAQLADRARQDLVALMCFEHDASECHRTIVAGALADLEPGLTIEHL
jgi:uncharacterized protein (DUF488 family)